jgi:hypothetical protein
MWKPFSSPNPMLHSADKPYPCGIITYMESNIESLKLDKSQIVISSLEEPSDEIAFWSSKSPAERLAAMEIMRQIVYGYNPNSSRLQRVLTIIKRA